MLRRFGRGRWEIQRRAVASAESRRIRFVSWLIFVDRGLTTALTGPRSEAAGACAWSFRRDVSLPERRQGAEQESQDEGNSDHHVQSYPLYTSDTAFANLNGGTSVPHHPAKVPGS